MTVRTTVKWALLALAMGSLAFLAVKESRQWDATSKAAEQGRAVVGGAAPAGMPATNVATTRVVAYYFHTTYRCATCRRIEAYAKEAIETGFAQELKSGRLEWRLVNVEIPENHHFAQDYRLVTKSVVLSRMKDGREVEWTNLKHIWDYVAEKPIFVDYVRGEVRKYLEKS